MAKTPGIAGEYYFGDIHAEPRDWREFLKESEMDDSDSFPNEERREVLARQLGFDPFENAENTGANHEPVKSPQVKSLSLKEHHKLIYR